MRRLCVYCGSNAGADDRYVRAARELGRTLSRRGIGLVYGGAKVGVMGAIADAVLEGDGEAIGVIPESLLQKEVAHEGLSALHVVQSMHDRKSKMAKLADGFVALPGGFGTLEEIIEVITWGQLGFHRKPCAFLNVGAYFDSLFAFIDGAVEEGFIRHEHRDMLICESRADTLLERLAAYQAPALPKWIDKT